MRASAIAARLLACALLSGCGGQGGTAATPAAGGGVATASVRVSIPAASTTSGLVRQSITAATKGILIQSYLHSDTAHANQTGGGAFDLSAASTLCTGTSPRTCTLSITLQPGNSDVVFTTYDAAPVSGSFTSAHQLGAATVYSVSLASGANTALNVAIGGTVASVTLTSTSQTLTGSSTGNYTLGFTAYDAASEVIVAGSTSVSNAGVTQTDAFSNPITFSVSEFGGAGHTTLSLNGGSHTSSVTAQNSSDTVTVYYDGASSLGYIATIAAAATGITSASATLNVQQLVADGNFATPSQATNTHCNSNLPSNTTFCIPSPWTVVGPYNIGIYNGNDGGDAVVAAGNQALLMQNNATGIKQTLTGLNPGSTYWFTFQAANGNAGTAGLQVMVNSTNITPSNAGSITSTFQMFTTQTFTAPANGQVTVMITDQGAGAANMDVTNVYLL